MKLKKVKVASVLDIFACVVQDSPIWAQVLLLLSYAEGEINNLKLITSAWYIWFLLVGTFVYLEDYNNLSFFKKVTPTELYLDHTGECQVKGSTGMFMEP